MHPYPPSGPDGPDSTDTRDTLSELLAAMPQRRDLADDEPIALTDLGQAVLAELRANA